MIQSRQDEVARILHALSGVPGGQEVDVYVRRFARADPAAPWRAYQEHRWIFGTHDLAADPPVAPPVPNDADEIVITLRGSMTEGRRDLGVRLADVIGSSEIDTDWEMHAVVTEDRSGPPDDDAEPARSFHLKVFQHTAPPVPWS